MKNLPTKIQCAPLAKVEDSYLLRLCDFYKAQNLDRGSMSELWTGIFDAYYRPMHDALLARDVKVLRSRLEAIRTNAFCFGVDDWLERGSSEFHLKNWADHFRYLADSLGILSFARAHEQADAKKVLDDIQAELGFLFDTFGNGAAFGAMVDGRCIPFKLLETACFWVEVRRSKPESILEVGAGLGTLGHLLGLLGVFSGKKTQWHTIDLPIMAVQQAFLIGANFGPHSIWLHGEHDNKDAQFFIHGLDLNVPKVDVVVNKDSLPEIPRTIAENYIRLFADRLNPNGVFYSVNQESGADGKVETGSQTRVFDLIKVEPRFSQRMRVPWIARQGYVLEAWSLI